MAVWPYLMGGAAATVAASAFAGSGWSVRTSALILCGLVGARIIHASPISGEYLDVVFAAMWVSLASFIPIAGHGSLSTATCAKVAVLICALCSLWGRITEYTVKMWSPPYMTADLMLILAILCVWWGIRHDIAFRISDMADRGGDMGYDTAHSGIGHSHPSIDPASSCAEKKVRNYVRAG